jgi:CHAT domain-containing protein
MVKARLAKQILAETPCGTCPQVFRNVEIWRGVAFDSLSAMPDEVRRGTVNYLPCPVCGNIASLWPGFLCYDSNQDRLIVSIQRLDSVEAMHALVTGALQHCEAADLGIPPGDPVGKAVFVTDYRHILHWLVADAAAFAVQAALFAKYWHRAGIEDTLSRARRALNDYYADSAVHLLGSEESSDFFALVADLAGRDRESCDPGDPRQAMIPPLLDHLARAKWTDAERARASGIAGIEPPDAEPVTQQLPQLAVEAVRSAFMAEAQRPDPPSLGLGSLADALLADLFRIAATTQFEGTRRTPIGTISSGCAARVEALITASSAAGLDLSFDNHHGKSGALRLALVDAAAGSSYWLARITHFFMWARSAAADGENVAAEFDRYVVEVVRETSSLEALAIAIVILTEPQRDPAYRKALQRAHLVTAYAHIRCHDRGTPMALLSENCAALGVSWELMASYLEDTPYTAGLCAGVAMVLFHRGGRKDGVLRARCIALQCRAAHGKFEEAEVDALIAEIRALVASAPEVYGDLEHQLATLLQMRAARLRSAASSPFVAMLPTAPPASGTEAALRYVWSRLRGRPGEDMVPNIAGWLARRSQKAFQRIIDRWIESCRTVRPNAAESDTIFILATALGTGSMKVEAVWCDGCAWVNEAVEAIALAATQGDRAWAESWLRFLHAVDELEIPALTRFFVQALRAEPQWKAARPMAATLAIMELEACIAGYREAGLDSSSETGPLIDELFREGGDADFETLFRAERTWSVSLGALKLGEVFEATGQLGAALGAYLLAARTERQFNQASHLSLYEAPDEFARVRPFMRMARALANAQAANPGLGVTPLCIELAEVAKAELQYLPAPAVGASRRVAQDYPDLAAAMTGLRVNLDTLGAHCPPGSSVLFYALLHDTPCNPGCWFAGSILPGPPVALSGVTMPFGTVYDAHLNVQTRMGEALDALIGLTLRAAAERVEGSRAELDAALERLADALISPAWIAAILERRLYTLFIVPEAYLFDIPWSALRVQTPEGRIALGELEIDGRALAISILPSLSALALKRPERDPDKPLKLAALSATAVDWLEGLASLSVYDQTLDALTQKLGAALSLEVHRESGVARVKQLLDGFEASALLFFGHGHCGAEGPSLIAADGFVGEREIKAAVATAPLRCDLALLLTCSGVSSARDDPGAMVSGVHMAAVRAGVGCVIGSSKPLLTIAALRLLDALTSSLPGTRFDQALGDARLALSREPDTSHPMFWGYITCFGNGTDRLGSLRSDDG